MARRIVGDVSAPIFYVVGPPAMTESIRQMLNRIGVSDDDLRSQDFFGY